MSGSKTYSDINKEKYDSADTTKGMTRHEIVPALWLSWASAPAPSRRLPRGLSVPCIFERPTCGFDRSCESLEQS